MLIIWINNNKCKDHKYLEQANIGPMPGWEHDCTMCAVPFPFLTSGAIPSRMIPGGRWESMNATDLEQRKGIALIGIQIRHNGCIVIVSADRAMRLIGYETYIKPECRARIVSHS